MDAESVDVERCSADTRGVENSLAPVDVDGWPYLCVRGLGLTLTINAGNSGRVGPGQAIALHTDIVGPIAIDDYYMAIVFASTGYTGELVSGTTIARGQRDVSVVLGRFDRFHLVDNSGGVADGASVFIQATLRHANDTVVEFANSSARAWDPVSQLWVLSSYLPAHDAMLDQILAAVIRTFPGNT